MTAAIVTAVLLLQTDPLVERVERIAGPVRRPLLWNPLAVTVASASGFNGDVVARSSFGVDFARRVELAPGGRRRVLLPAVDPVEVLAGGASVAVPAARLAPEVLVGVDSRLSFADGLESDDRRVYRKIDAADLEELLGLGLLEAFDLLLLADSAGLPLAAYGSMGRWASPRTPAEAGAAVEGFGPAVPRFEAVDVGPRRLWELAPRGGWVPAKRTHAAFFAALYAFAGFVGLIAAARRGTAALAAAATGLAAVFVGVYFLLFPRGHLWLVEHSCEVVGAGGEAAEWRVWFVGAGATVKADVVFPRLVKPVFQRAAGADEPFTIRLEGRGCRVEGLKISAGGAFCFVAGGDRPPTMRAAGSVPAGLYGAGVVRGGRHRLMGDLPAGGEVPALVVEDEPLPREPDFAALLSRFLSGDCVFGRLARDERPARDVTSPGLADARARPRLWLQRLR